MKKRAKIPAQYHFLTEIGAFGDHQDESSEDRSSEEVQEQDPWETVGFQRGRRDQQD